MDILPDEVLERSILQSRDGEIERFGSIPAKLVNDRGAIDDGHAKSAPMCFEAQIFVLSIQEYGRIESAAGVAERTGDPEGGPRDPTCIADAKVVRPDGSGCFGQRKGETP